MRGRKEKRQGAFSINRRKKKKANIIIDTRSRFLSEGHCELTFLKAGYRIVGCTAPSVARGRAQSLTRRLTSGWAPSPTLSLSRAPTMDASLCR